MKLNILKPCLAAFICLTLIMCSFGCKKDKTTTDQVKNFDEVGHVAQNPYDGGWSVTLYPDGTANILPNGDISYSGTYYTAGLKLIIKTEQNDELYIFKIISATEIKEKEFGAVLRLRQ